MDNSNRIATLIDKLKEQNAQGLPYSYLMITAQMLLSELTIDTNRSGAVVGSAVVSNPFVTNTANQVSNLDENSTQQAQALKLENTSDNRFALPKLDLPEIPFLRNWSEEKTADTNTVSQKLTESIQEPQTESIVIPQEKAELHEKLQYNEEYDINEKLNENKVELASLLNATPLADLRNAVGINDRFVFIQELFNADENMYERCIKTINAFTTFAEAQSWIKRELKVKLGWKENSESVLHFDQLVKRRFS